MGDVEQLFMIISIAYNCKKYKKLINRQLRIGVLVENTCHHILKICIFLKYGDTCFHLLLTFHEEERDMLSELNLNHGECKIT